MTEESSTNDQTNTATNEEPSVILPSNNFLGLLPPPYSMSTLKTSLSSVQNSPPSFSSLTTNKYVPMATSNNYSTTTSYINRSSSALLNDPNGLNTSTYSTPLSNYRTFPKPAVFHQSRERERNELSSLNDKFADYVEKVRYLEAQNKKVQMETGLLNEKQTNHCQRVKSIFENEVSQLREVIEKMFKEKNTTIYAVKEAQNGLVTSRQRLNQTFKECDSSKYETEKVERQLSNVEGDILMFKRRLAHQDDEQTKWKQLIVHVQRLLLQAKNETQNEILTRSTCEQTVKQLKTDLGKLRDEHEGKFRDLKQNTFQIGHNATNDRAHIFKSELSSAIRKIRQDFENENEQQRNELYLRFNQTYENLARENPEIGHLFLNEREQERIRQEEDRLRAEIQRIKIDSNQLKQKNAELKLRAREIQINLEMTIDENSRLQKMQQNEIEQLKSKQERVAKDYDDVISKQTSLEKEIETYRNLLEGTMKTVVDTITDDYNSATNSNRNPTNTTTSTTTNPISSNYVSSPRTPRSVSVDRSSSSPYLSASRLNGYSGSGSNLYSRYSSNRFSNKLPSNESTQIETPKDEQNSSNGLSTSKSAADLSSEQNFPTTTTTTIIETSENETGPSATNSRLTTVLNTRRN